jgi:hypothetical protein
MLELSHPDELQHITHSYKTLVQFVTGVVGWSSKCWRSFEVFERS